MDADALHYFLMKTSALLTRNIMAKAAENGLTSGQPKVLECLAELEEADQKTIAKFCEIEPATVGSILLRMEQAGLVRRRQREGNRRSLFVSLTEEGKKAAEKMLPVFVQVDETALSALTREEREQFLDSLKKVYGSLSQDR